MSSVLYLKKFIITKFINYKFIKPLTWKHQNEYRVGEFVIMDA